MIENIYNGFRIEEIDGVYVIVGLKGTYATLIEAFQAADAKWYEFFPDKSKKVSEEPK